MARMSSSSERLGNVVWPWLSSFESPAHPVKSLTSNCPAPGAHSTMRSPVFKLWRRCPAKVLPARSSLRLSLSETLCHVCIPIAPQMRAEFARRHAYPPSSAQSEVRRGLLFVYADASVPDQ